MNSGEDWTPAEISDMFNISKATLLRWEREGKIAPPRRDGKLNRWYTRKNRAEVAKLVLQRGFKKFCTGEAKPGAEETAGYLGEQIALSKLVDMQNIAGLYELDELVKRRKLMPTTIHRLLQEALNYDPSDPTFCEIIGLIHEGAVGGRVETGEA